MIDSFWFAVGMLINAAVLIVLTVNVSRLRIKNQISLGDGGNKDLQKAIRAHANGIEQVPVFMLMVLALVFTGTSDMMVAVLVITFSLSRIAHAVGMLGGPFIFRRVGAAVTFLAQIVICVLLLIALLV